MVKGYAHRKEHGPLPHKTAGVVTAIGIDIGKDVCHLVGFNPEGKFVPRKKIKRLALVRVFENLPPCIVGMEACLSARFVSRTSRKSAKCHGSFQRFTPRPFRGSVNANFLEPG